MAEDSDEIETVVCAAVELASAEERAEFIRRQCEGNDARCRRVEKLVDAYLRAGNFLESPLAMLSQSLDWEMPEALGANIGRYRLIEQIGEGGFGSVYLAEQVEPLRRRVALKIIKLGMDTRKVVARFEAERQALAMMDHPCIAKVLDAGATKTGRPYFVMELVHGAPITSFCDAQRLGIRERLALFEQVCQAVQHAHQKGIIHRDLKPTNVLVSTEEGRPVAKVIDFGVAKAIEGRLTEKTLFTEHQQLIGTPAYMSPEQADGTLDVDTRSDVYSLGVLLYELLTGAPPFDPQELRSKAFAEMQRIIREVDPPTPSARLVEAASTATAGPSAADPAPRHSLVEIAGNRGVEPKRLSASLRGELDWIVMRCLEKDRARRYQGANNLAEDIQRYLADLPVEARPPTAGYLFKKFISRHRSAAALLAIIAASFVGLVVSILAINRERAAKAAAVTQIDREVAKANEIAGYFKDILGAADPDRANDLNYTVRQLLDKSSENLTNRFADQPEVEAEIRETIGVAYRNLEEFEDAEPHLQRVVELRRQTVGIHHELYADSLVAWAWNLAVQGRGEEATKLVEQALSIYRPLSSNPAKQLGALRLYEWIDMSRTDDVVRQAEKLAAMIPSGDNPDLASILHCHAEKLVRIGRPAEAETLAERALAMHRRTRPSGHTEIAYSLWTLGLALERQGKYADAERAYREALDIYRRLYGTRTEMRGHGLFVEGLYRVFMAQSRADEAETLLARNAEQSHGSTVYWVILGSHRVRMGNLPGALEAYNKAIELNPDDHQALFRIALVLLKAGNEDEYRRHMHHYLEVASSTQDLVVADMAAKAALLLPVDPPDIDRAYSLVDSIEAKCANPSLTGAPPLSPWSYLVISMAAYRRGRFEPAQSYAQQAIEKEGSAPEARSAAWFICAAASAKINQTERALRALKAGNEILDSTPRVDVVTRWPDWMIAEHLRDQAARVLGPSSPANSGKTAPSAN